ncbi:hypothetical protein DL95DRAFT_419304, partial [Leptodontidium sp. 2 PMI_412]
LRCQADPQCRSFLWEVHEASARNSLTQPTSPRPATPPSTNNPGTALYLPTPSTASSASTLPTLYHRLPTPDESPTWRRGKNAVTSAVAADDEEDEDDEGTLLSQIVARLGTDGFQLKLSTKEYLGHILREEIAIYEAKLRTRDVTIARLSGKLDQLTVNENVQVKLHEVPVADALAAEPTGRVGSNGASVSSASFQDVLETTVGLFICFQSLLSCSVTEPVLFTYASSDLNAIMLCLLWQSNSGHLVPSRLILKAMHRFLILAYQALHPSCSTNSINARNCVEDHFLLQWLAI